MAEGGQNPDDTPQKRLRGGDHGDDQRQSPDINVKVIGPENSTIGTSIVAGVVKDGVGTQFSDHGDKTEVGPTPDESPWEKRRKNDLIETKEESRNRLINVTANGPKDSNVKSSVVVGQAEYVTIQNEGKGEITMKCQHDLQRKLLDSTREKISIWTKGMIQVSAVDLVIEKLKHGNNWITITGSAGVGKTTLGHFVLRDFVDKMNVYVIETPEDYRQISQIEEDRIILLNDIFGSFTFDSSSVNKWRNVVTDICDIQMKRSHRVTKVVFVSRMNVLQEVITHLERYGKQIIDDQNWFDLNQFHIEKERLQILQYHLQRKGITVSELLKQIVANTDTVHGFPHCCEMYAELVSKGQDIDIVEFFKTPLEFLDKTTNLLFETGCKELFIKMIKGDGIFCTENIEDDEERWVLEEQAKRQEGSYLAKYEGNWVFHHPSIYESVLSIVAYKDPLSLAKYASMSIISKKVRFNTTGSETAKCYIPLDPKPLVVDCLVERFAEELKQKKYDVFEHEIGKTENFIERIITNLATTEHNSEDLINMHDPIGYTMLQYAVKASNCPGVRSLLSHGADPNLRDKTGKGELMLILLNTFMSFFRETEFKIYNRYDVTPLHHLCACTEMSVEVLQLLLDNGADVTQIDKKGQTPPFYLCGRKEINFEALQILLNHGADVDHIDLKGMTLFSHFCESKEVSVEALKLLIKCGANVNHIGWQGKNPLHHLCGSKNVSIEALQLLLNSGADFNHFDSEGMTPLHFLCGRGSVRNEALLLFVNHGAEVNQIDREGKTPLFYLCGSVEVSVEVLQFMFNCGADISHIDNEGKTPLHHLCGSGTTTEEVLQFLLNSGANVNQCDMYGCTPLHSLCENLDFSVNPLQLGASVNYSDEKRQNIFGRLSKMFRWLFSFENVEVFRERWSEYHAVMETLIKNGCDVNKTDSAGNTPLHTLCHLNQWPLISSRDTRDSYRSALPSALRVLVRGGADVNLRNKREDTPMDILRRKLPNYNDTIEYSLNVLLNNPKS